MKTMVLISNFFSSYSSFYYSSFHYSSSFCDIYIFSIVYKEFLAAYVKVPSITTMTAVPEGASSNASSPVVPRLDIAGVTFPPLEKDQEILKLLEE